jgi:hypothetical protein
MTKESISNKNRHIKEISHIVDIKWSEGIVSRGNIFKAKKVYLIATGVPETALQHAGRSTDLLSKVFKTIKPDEGEFVGQIFIGSDPKNIMQSGERTADLLEKTISDADISLASISAATLSLPKALEPLKKKNKGKVAVSAFSGVLGVDGAKGIFRPAAKCAAQRLLLPDSSEWFDEISWINKKLSGEGWRLIFYFGRKDSMVRKEPTGRWIQEKIPGAHVHVMNRGHPPRDKELISGLFGPQYYLKNF